jgi:RimJ/RimL family protein N-acetyltransferase
MELVRLSSGLEASIRPIRPDDASRIQAAYGRLSPETQYQRFLTIKPRLTRADLHYLTDLDGDRHFALVASPITEPNRIVAVARFVRASEDPGTAEFAIVVGDEFQGAGLGSVLLERLADAARARGVERFTATMLADNAAVRHLVDRLAGSSAHARHVGPTDELEIDLAA